MTLPYVFRGVELDQNPYLFKSIKERKPDHLDDPIKSEQFGGEAEKQDLIWKAFGVDYSHEIKQLEDACERFIL